MVRILTRCKTQLTNIDAARHSSQHLSFAIIKVFKLRSALLVTSVLSSATASSLRFPTIFAVDDASVADCPGSGTYENLDWAELTEAVQAAAGVIGYNEDIWDEGGRTISDQYQWDEISSEIQAASLVLGCDQACWVNCD